MAPEQLKGEAKSLHSLKAQRVHNWIFDDLRGHGKGQHCGQRYQAISASVKSRYTHHHTYWSGFLLNSPSNGFLMFFCWHIFWHNLASSITPLESKTFVTGPRAFFEAWFPLLLTFDEGKKLDFRPCHAKLAAAVSPVPNTKATRITGRTFKCGNNMKEIYSAQSKNFSQTTR